VLENNIDAGRPPLSLSRAARTSAAGYGAAYDVDGGDDGQGASGVRAASITFSLSPTS